MGSMNRLKAKANRHFKQAQRLRKGGVKVAPLEAHKVDHHRVDDAWRQTGKHKGPNATPWKGAKGKQKKQRFPK